MLRNDAWLTGAPEFWSLCAASGVTVIDLPTRFWQQIAEDPATQIPLHVRLLIIGGELVEPRALAKWFQRGGHRPNAGQLLWTDRDDGQRHAA